MQTAISYFTALTDPRVDRTKAERLNGNIQRFISANYEMRDKDFALYRIAGYFS